MRYLLTLLFPLFLFQACSVPEEGPLTDFPNSHLLISAEELYERIRSAEEFVLIDARAETGDTLIPGALHFAAISELSDPDIPIASYLIGPDLFGEKMSGLGLNNSDRVVIYDDGNALAAARLFYALDYYGFSGASILNGGLESWLSHGFEITNEAVIRDPGTFLVEIQEALMCDLEYIMEAANSPDKLIFDARSVAEFTGEEVRAERGGHIPNAVNIEWRRVLQPEGTPYFLPAEDIRLLFEENGITPDKEVIPHCHTNVRGSHAYFTLRLMGYDSVRPYEGSWAEYGNSANALIQ